METNTDRQTASTQHTKLVQLNASHISCCTHIERILIKLVFQSSIFLLFYSLAGALVAYQVHCIEQIRRRVRARTTYCVYICECWERRKTSSQQVIRMIDVYNLMLLPKVYMEYYHTGTGKNKYIVIYLTHISNIRIVRQSLYFAHSPCRASINSNPFLFFAENSQQIDVKRAGHRITPD